MVAITCTYRWSDLRIMWYCGQGIWLYGVIIWDLNIFSRLVTNCGQCHLFLCFWWCVKLQCYDTWWMRWFHIMGVFVPVMTFDFIPSHSFLTSISSHFCFIWSAVISLHLMVVTDDRIALQKDSALSTTKSLSARSLRVAMRFAFPSRESHGPLPWDVAK